VDRRTPERRRRDRHARRRVSRRAQGGSEHHARRGRAACPAERLPRAGRQGGRDGSVVAWSGTRTRERRALRVRAVHQPHSRSSRLSRFDGGLRRGEGAPLRSAGAAERGAQPRRCVRPRARPSSCGPATHHRLQPGAARRTGG
jgi:hypothetical protein